MIVEKNKKQINKGQKNLVAQVWVTQHIRIFSKNQTRGLEIGPYAWALFIFLKGV